MAVQLMVNVEALVSEFLQADADMVAIISDRTYTVIPNNKVFPLVRVTQFDDEKITQRPLWVVRHSLQIEAWGDTAWDAWRTAATTQSVLAERLPGVHSRGTVTGVQFGSLRNQPDTSYSPAKQRRLFTAFVTAHP